MAREVQLMLVVGSPNSSNSNRLVEVAKRSGVQARLIDDAGDQRRSGSKASKCRV